MIGCLTLTGCSSTYKFLAETWDDLMEYLADLVLYYAAEESLFGGVSVSLERIHSTLVSGVLSI